MAVSYFPIRGYRCHMCRRILNCLVVCIYMLIWIETAHSQNGFANERLDPLVCDSYDGGKIELINKRLKENPTRTGFQIFDASVTNDGQWIVVLLMDLTKVVNSESAVRPLNWMLVALSTADKKHVRLRPSDALDEATSPYVAILEPLSEHKMLVIEHSSRSARCVTWDPAVNRVEEFDMKSIGGGLSTKDIAVNLARNQEQPFQQKLALPKHIEANDFRTRFRTEIGLESPSVVSRGLHEDEIIFVAEMGDVVMACLDSAGGQVLWELREDALRKSLDIHSERPLRFWIPHSRHGFQTQVPLFVEQGLGVVLVGIGEGGTVAKWAESENKWVRGSPILTDDGKTVCWIHGPDIREYMDELTVLTPRLETFSISEMKLSSTPVIARQLRHGRDHDRIFLTTERLFVAESEGTPHEFWTTP